MGFVEQLDELDRTERTPAEKMREALAMYDEGLAMQRQMLRRRHPRLGAEEVEQKLSRWLMREEFE